MKWDIRYIWATSGNLIYKLAIKFSGEHTAMSMAKSSPYLFNATEKKQLPF